MGVAWISAPKGAGEFGRPGPGRKFPFLRLVAEAGLDSLHRETYGLFCCVVDWLNPLVQGR